MYATPSVSGTGVLLGPKVGTAVWAGVVAGVLYPFEHAAGARAPAAMRMSSARAGVSLAKVSSS